MSDPAAREEREAEPVLVGLDEAFAAHSVSFEAGPSAVADARLTAAVAAALMATLDWLAGTGKSRPTFRARLDDSCLEVTARPGDLRGVRAAAEILAMVGANLQPLPGGIRGLWRMRVPLAGEPASFLMVERGGLSLALPWTAVLSVLMTDEETMAEARLGAPMLPRPGHADDGMREFPVVLIAHGLRRAYLAADRLVWRLRADLLPFREAPPALGLVRPVLGADGEEYWLADPGVLLAGIEALPIPEEALPLRDIEPAAPEPAAPGAEAPPSPAPAPGQAGAAAEPSAPPAGGPQREPATGAPLAAAPETDATPAPEHAAPQSSASLAAEAGSLPARGDATPVPEHEPALSTPAEPAPAPATSTVSALEPARPAVAPPAIARLTAHDVIPLDRAQGVEAPAVPASAPAPDATPGRRAGAPRHALLAEDSFIARIFLARLLEQRGFEVVAVAAAAELFEALPRRPWDLVLADVQLGDAGGASLVRRVGEHLARLAATETRGAAQSPPLVALVRDARDIAEARAGGARLTMLKPYDAAELDALLAGIGLRT